MIKIGRISFVVIGLLALAATLAFFFQLPIATQIWPWPVGRLSYIFIASISAAIGAPVLWIGLSGKLRAAAPWAINLLITFGATAIYGFNALNTENNPQLAILSTSTLILALLTGVILIWAIRQPLVDERPIPHLAKYSYILFAVLLIIVAISLITRQPHILPWPLDANSTVIFGWIFMGAAAYFLFVFAEPYWQMTQGQLLGFLAYDLVLIGPFLAHFSNVLPEHRLSLIIYTGVLIYSGGLAIYYLFLRSEFRFNLLALFPNR
jgi:hypothetical protein